jgi:hypothetical protein
METVIRDRDIRISSRVKIREMSDAEFVEQHASGTLRKNKRLGMAWKSQYYHERVCYEFGHSFEMLPRSYITFGDAITEGDNHFMTEAGWYMERYLNLDIFDDYIEIKYIHVEYPDGSKKEGVGMIIRETSAKWVPQGQIIFAVVAVFDPDKKQFTSCENPF